ncbi:MAG: hypothetical protein WA817_09820 [Candidatus Acidiferrum sp.]
MPKKEENRVKTALFLNPSQVSALKGLQQSFPGINMSEHIRRAVDLYLEQMKQVAKRMPELPGAPKEKK